MKTQKTFKIKTFLLSLIMISMLAPITVLSQQNKGETKQEKKEREKAEQLQRYQQARLLVLDTAFAVPAESVQFRDGGAMTPVQSTINFLKVDGNDAVLQIGSDFARNPGMNNLGGFTLKGKILNLKIKEKESKNNLFMTFNVTGVIGTASISMSLIGSEKAVIDVDGMFSGRAFSMRGSVQTLQETNVFEGTEF